MRRPRFAVVSVMRGAPWGGSEELWAACAFAARRDGWRVLASLEEWPETPPRVEELEAAVAGAYDAWVAVVTEHGRGVLVDWRPRRTFRIDAGPWERFSGRAVSSHLAAGTVFLDYEWICERRSGTGA